MAYGFESLLILFPFRAQQFPACEGCERPSTGKVCTRVLGSIVVEEARV